MRQSERFAWTLVGLLVATPLLGGGYQATTLQNGDVNGDTLVDVGDPVYLLNYLFGLDPSPVACAQTTPAAVEAAVDAALARYLPRAGERVFISEPVPLGATVDLVTIPPGKVFMFEQYPGGGVWEPNLRILTGATIDEWQVPKRPAIAFLPGEVISLNNMNGSGNTTASRWGYWLDYVP